MINQVEYLHENTNKITMNESSIVFVGHTRLFSIRLLVKGIVVQTTCDNLRHQMLNYLLSVRITLAKNVG